MWENIERARGPQCEYEHFEWLNELGHLRQARSEANPDFETTVAEARARRKVAVHRADLQTLVDCLDGRTKQRSEIVEILNRMKELLK
jgi:hypothetical protein